MTITIDVPTELEQRLERASQQRGIGKAAFLQSLLEEKLRSETETPPFAFPAEWQVDSVAGAQALLRPVHMRHFDFARDEMAELGGGAAVGGEAAGGAFPDANIDAAVGGCP